MYTDLFHICIMQTHDLTQLPLELLMCHGHAIVEFRNPDLTYVDDGSVNEIFKLTKAWSTLIYIVIDT